MKTDYKDVVVHKPWGYEYLFYENEQVAIWCLHINKGESTSLHCHPKKKTGLIMLSGEATLSFLNDTMELKPLSRLIIRPGLFHSTKALSNEVVLLEVETPPEKEDIVRFDDKYGRKGLPIEGNCCMSERPKEYPVLDEVGECMINGCTIERKQYSYAKTGDIIAVLYGGIFSKRRFKKDQLLVGPGDVGTIESFSRLSKSFYVPPHTELLTICAPQPSD